MERIPIILVFRRIGQIILALFKYLPKLKQGGPRYWRFVIEDLGGGIIKIAQILAMRYEILPKRYCEEFAGLFDAVAPISPKEIQEVFKEEFGALPESIFEKFSYESFASASFGQVHIAELKNQKLAVKIQKPDVQRWALADILIIKFLAFGARLVIRAPVDLREAVREWESWTLRELDYRLEAENAERFRAQNTNPEVYIPKVFKEYSRAKILTEEFLEGVSLNEIHRDTEILSLEDRTRITKKLVYAQLWAYFKTGFFHADPHPGNVILLGDGRLAFVDFGIMGQAGTPRENHHFANFIKFSAEGVIEEAVGHFRKVMTGAGALPIIAEILPGRLRRKPAAKLEKGFNRFLVHKLGAVILRWGERVGSQEESLLERSTARHFLSLLSLGQRFGLEMPVNLLAFIRSTIIVDMICLLLNPEFNMKEELSSYFREYPEVCGSPVLEMSSVAETKVSLMFGSRERLIEKYREDIFRILEKIIEEGSHALAYFSTRL
ncbi:AarF/ABC1/UbiB kinase family protein [Candidatus Wolfebacteria bacterium]|nr:AarF/ABC1/UbiB kinase family protein [Candidatus Wolfebacteria bacterium]